MFLIDIWGHVWAGNKQCDRAFVYSVHRSTGGGTILIRYLMVSIWPV